MLVTSHCQIEAIQLMLVTPHCQIYPSGIPWHLQPLVQRDQQSRVANTSTLGWSNQIWMITQKQRGGFAFLSRRELTTFQYQ